MKKKKRSGGRKKHRAQRHTVMDSATSDNVGVIDEPVPETMRESSPVNDSESYEAEKEPVDRVIRFNQTLVITTVAVLGVLAVGVYLIHGFMVEKNAGSLLKQAHQKHDAGEIREAVKYLSQYVKMLPEYPDDEATRTELEEARALLGTLVFDTAETYRDWTRVYLEFDKLHRLNPNRDETRRKQIQAAMKLGRFEDARDHIGILREQRLVAGQPFDAELLMWGGQSLQAGGKFQSAALRYLLAIGSDKQIVENYSLLAGSILRRPDQPVTRENLKQEQADFDQELQARAQELEANADNFAIPENLIAPQLFELFPSADDEMHADRLAQQFLELMVQQGRPRYQAYLLRAEYRKRLITLADAAPMNTNVAEARAEELLLALDSSEEKGVLEAEEWASSLLVPFGSDMNEDGRITPEELQQRFERGDALARLDLAKQDIDRAIEDAPEELDVLLAAGDLALLHAQTARQEGHTAEVEASLEAARRYAELGLQRDPPPLQCFLMLYRIESDRYQTEQQPELLQAAQQHLQTGLEAVAGVREQSPESEQSQIDALEIELLWSLADTLISQSSMAESDGTPQKSDEAQDVLAQLGQTEIAPALVDFLQGRQLLIDREWRRAADDFENARRDLAYLPQVVHRIDLFLGECYEQLGNPHARLEVFRRAMSENPLWIPGRFHAAQTLLVLNQTDQGLEELSALGGIPGVPLLLARHFIIEQLSQKKEQRRWNRVLSAIQAEEDLRSKRGLPKSIDAIVLRAEVLGQQGEFDVARDLLETARNTADLDPAEEVKLWVALANLSLQHPPSERATSIQRAQAILQQAVDHLGDRVELRLGAAGIAVLQTAENARLSLADLETAAESFSVKERVQLWEGLAQAYGRTGSAEDVQRLWSQIAQAQPKSLRPRLVLAELAMRNGKQRELQELLPEIRTIEGDEGPNGDYLQAVGLLLSIEDDPEIRNNAEKLKIALVPPRVLLEHAADKRPDWAELARTLGNVEWILAESLQTLPNEDAALPEIDYRGKAVAHYENAIELGDRSRLVVFRVAKTLANQNRIEEADQLLRTLEEKETQPLTGNLARLAREVAFNLRQWDRALELAVNLSTEDRTVVDRLREAGIQFIKYQHLQTDGNHDAATESLDAAIAAYREIIDDKDHRLHDTQKPLVWSAYILHLVRAGLTSEAITAIDDARRQFPKEPPYLVPLHLGAYYQLVNDLEQAEENFQQAVKLAPLEARVLKPVAQYYVGIGKVDQAREYVDTILDPNHEFSTDDRSWARNASAILTSYGGTYTDTVQALQILDQESGNKTSLAQLRARAAILMRRPFHNDRLELIDVYNQIAERQSLAPDDRFRLARLYEAVGLWPQAAELLRELLTESPNNALVVAQYTQGLIREQDFDQAEVSLAQLQSLLPDSLAVVTLQSKLLHAQGKSQLAATLIRDYTGNLPQASSPEATFRDLVSQNKAEEALAWLEERLAAQGDAAAAQTVKEGRRLLSDGQVQKAADILQEHLRRTDIQKLVRQYNLRIAARLLDELGYTQDAELVFREYMQESENPQDVLLLVSYVARQGRIDEALNLCEESWKTLSPRAAANASVAVIRAGEASGEQIKRVEDWLADAIMDQPQTTFILARLADLRDYQGRYREAEVLYRTILKQNDRNLMALNNLAWLSAVQGKQQEDALKLIKRAIDLAGPAAELLDTKATVHLSLNQPRQAIKDLTTAIAAAPSALKHFHLAAAQLQAGDEAAASEAYEKAREMKFSKESLHPLELPEYKRVDAKLAK